MAASSFGSRPLRRISVPALFAAALAVAPAAHAVPPPPEQVSADCSTPTYATDQLVCGDAELRAMDAAMVQALGKVSPGLLDNPPPFVESQTAWFKRRSMCAFDADGRACTQDAYAERLAVLGELAVAGAGGRSVRCERPLRAQLSAHTNQNLTVLRNASGGVEAVALLPDAHSGWKAFAEYTTKGKTIRLVRADGVRMECR